MGNQPSTSTNANASVNGHSNGTNHPYKEEDANAQPPCCFFLPSLPRKHTSDAIGSPLPATPPLQRHKRQQVAAAMRTGSHSGSSAGSASYLLPPKYGSKLASKAPQLEKEMSSSSTTAMNGGGTSNGLSIAPVHEGPDAEALLQQTYELQEVLGVGSTSTVQKCRHRQTGEVYACKVIDVQQIEERFAGMMDQFQTEIEALRQLRHPGIIGLYDVYIVPGHKIYIIMECMQGGELFDYVVQKGTLTEEEASEIVRKVTSALVYMHDKNIVHRDLKPENLLLKRKRAASTTAAVTASVSHPPSIEVKIIDFGLSKVCVCVCVYVYTFCSRL